MRTQNFDLAVYAAGSPDAGAVALVLPGKLDTKDYAHMRSHVDFLAGMGYFALSFDPPGTWGSGGTLEDYTLDTHIQAIHELIEALGNRPTVLVGHSLGGCIAMIAGSKNPCVTHMVAIMSPWLVEYGIKEYPEWERTGYNTSYRDAPDGSQKTFELPYGFYESIQKYSTISTFESLRHSTQKKLFIAGVYDETIPASSVRKFYEASGEPKSIVEVDSDHNYRFYPDTMMMLNTLIKAFLK